MVLFLDDDSNRVRRFRREVPSARIATTAHQMIGLLERYQSQYIKYLFLDHDLGDQVYVDSERPDTGMEVVRWLEKNQLDIGLVVVHSLNHGAAERMVSRLSDAGYNVERHPFTSLDYSLVEDEDEDTPVGHERPETDQQEAEETG